MRRLACHLTLLLSFAAFGAPVAYARPATDKPPAHAWTHWWGSVQFGRNQITLDSAPPTALAETHSSLVTTKRIWNNPTISFTTTTVRQLRENDPPNVWEVGWVMFRFTSLHSYYWFILKTDGFELGKKQGSDTQIFLATGDTPALTVGEAHRVRVVAAGARIRVFVDGTQVVDFTDPHPLAHGAVGLYEEDSQASFSGLRISGR